MGGINSLSGLNTVNVDFRPTVELIKPKTNNSNQLLPGGDVVPQNVPQPPKAEAKSVVQQLDVLLLNAAGKSVSADTVKNVNTIGTSLVAKGVLTQKELSKLESLAETRLNEAIDHAKKLKEAGKVYGTNQWQDKTNLFMMTGVVQSVEIEKSDGTTITADSNLQHVRDLCTRECPSLYKREKFDGMFVKFEEL